MQHLQIKMPLMGKTSSRDSNFTVNCSFSSKQRTTSSLWAPNVPAPEKTEGYTGRYSPSLIPPGLWAFSSPGHVFLLVEIEASSSINWASKPSIPYQKQNTTQDQNNVFLITSYKAYILRPYATRNFGDGPLSIIRTTFGLRSTTIKWLSVPPEIKETINTFSKRSQMKELRYKREMFSMTMAFIKVRLNHLLSW